MLYPIRTQFLGPGGLEFSWHRIDFFMVIYGDFDGD